jgi:membrane-bound inhibitor of C-type lysozyme
MTRLLLVMPLLLALGGCSSPRLWPFGEAESRPAVPENSVQYQCNGGKRFFLRMLSNGDAWVILPEREFRLERVASAPGRRFSNGVAVLELGDAATGASLNDGPAIAFSGCKVAEKP